MWDGSRAVKALEAGQPRVRMWPEINRAEWPYFMTFVSQCLSPESIRKLDPQPGEGYEETFGSPDLNLVGGGPAWVSLGGRGRLPLLMEKPWGDAYLWCWKLRPSVVLHGLCFSVPFLGLEYFLHKKLR